MNEVAFFMGWIQIVISEGSECCWDLGTNDGK